MLATDDFIILFLDLLNEVLTSAIVVVAASLLLYNLSKNLDNRVARTSAIVLACVTVAYAADAFIALEPTRNIHIATLRLQWIGIAFLPAALLHLSDALLATTGLPSRGRRKRIIRILYGVSGTFLAMAGLTNILVRPTTPPMPAGLRADAMFPVFMFYYVVATIVAFINVQRAKQRCLTRSTQRRMAYLQFAMLTPVMGLFPFSVLLGPGEEFSFWAMVFVNVANIVVVLMLLFLAYPLSFFGSSRPDRVVKLELLKFLLRGPGTALVALVMMTFLTPTSRIFGLEGEEFKPFAVVAVILAWQWSVALTLPWLERSLIYAGEDVDQLGKLQSLSERLLTRSDLEQLLEAILEATCDYLRVSTAFIAIVNDDGLETISTITPSHNELSIEKLDNTQFETLLNNGDPLNGGHRNFAYWDNFWIFPLYTYRTGDNAIERSVIGIMGIEAQNQTLMLNEDEEEMLKNFVLRAEQTLDDILLQEEMYAALEGLLPQFTIDRRTADALEYRPGHTRQIMTPSHLPDFNTMRELVRAALRHYWGGPGLSRSRLLELNIVRQALPEHDNNPARALRAILLEAIERQQPEGERQYTSPEWTIYNILHMRFIERRKVRDVAIRLAVSEPDFYRKQRSAIDAITQTLIDMENQTTHTS